MAWMVWIQFALRTDICATYAPNMLQITSGRRDRCHRGPRLLATLLVGVAARFPIFGKVRGQVAIQRVVLPGVCLRARV